MPINDGTYSNPDWVNSSAPALSATGELTALSDTAYSEQLEVGDIVLSVRGDYGTEYVRLDGRGFNSADHPNLVQYITSSQYKLQETQISTAAIALYDAFCYHGVWVITGGIKANYNNDKRTNRSPYIFTTTDINGTWTGQQLSNIQAHPSRVFCYNGLWIVAVGQYIYYTNDPSGTWNELQFTTSSFNAQDIYCANGTWVIAGFTLGTNNIYVSTSPKSLWTGYEVTGVSGAYGDIGIAYGNGYWYIAGGIVASASDPTSTWATEISATLEAYYGITYDADNDLWLAAGQYGATKVPRYAYKVSGSNTWVKANPTGTGYGYLTKAKYSDGKYVMLGYWGSGSGSTDPRYVKIWFTDDVTSTWTQLDLTSSSTAQKTAEDMFGYNSKWVVAGYAVTPRPHIWTFDLAYDYYVPNINLDGCYGYVIADCLASLNAVTSNNSSSPYIDEDNMQDITDCVELWQKKIGDIIITYSNNGDLGANWLKCDGSTVSRLDYPTLVNMIHAIRGTSGNTTTLPNLTSVGVAYVKAL